MSSLYLIYSQKPDSIFLLYKVGIHSDETNGCSLENYVKIEHATQKVISIAHFYLFVLFTKKLQYEYIALGFVNTLTNSMKYDPKGAIHFLIGDKL